MSRTESKIGTIPWHDLTVDDALGVRDSHAEVINWKASPQSMGDYDDYSIETPDGTCLAGICHRRGPNAGIPPHWMTYVNVAGVDRSADRCTQLGGKVVDGSRMMGNYRFCIIQDPAGARRRMTSSAPAVSRSRVMTIAPQVETVGMPGGSEVTTKACGVPPGPAVAPPSSVNVPARICPIWGGL